MTKKREVLVYAGGSQPRSPKLVINYQRYLKQEGVSSRSTKKDKPVPEARSRATVIRS